MLIIIQSYDFKNPLALIHKLRQVTLVNKGHLSTTVNILGSRRWAFVHKFDCIYWNRAVTQTDCQSEEFTAMSNSSFKHGVYWNGNVRQP